MVPICLLLGLGYVAQAGEDLLGLIAVEGVFGTVHLELAVRHSRDRGRHVVKCVAQLLTALQDEVPVAL